MRFEPTDCLAILGTRGCGKTTLSKRLQKAWPRQVIIDPVNEYKDGDVVSNFDRFSEKMLEYSRSKKKNFRLIYQFDPETDDLEPIFNGILRVCYHFKNVQVVVEEVQMFSTAHKIPLYLKNSLFTGRHQGLSLLFVTQRPGQLNKNILSQCRHVFVGQLHDKNDIQTLSNFISVEPEKIANLSKGKFFYFTPGEKIKLIDNRS